LRVEKRASKATTAAVIHKVRSHPRATRGFLAGNGSRNHFCPLTDSGSRPSDDHRDTDDLFVIHNGREPTHKDGDVIAIILLAPIAYLVGTFPSAVLIARARGVDITASGSGNPGASNVGRLLGRKLGVLVFVLDGLKGAVSVAIGYLVAGHAGALALACAAVVGHVFPITRGFKGGKGVATAGGSVIALYPIIGVAMTALWLITAKLTKKASLGSLAIAIGFPISQAIAGRPWGEIVTGAGLCAFVIWRHLPNLKRLVKGDELSLKKDAP
jgi:glycerol-3-phosphate acyltransferase PlsY